MTTLVIAINVTNPITTDMGRYLSYSDIIQSMSLFEAVTQTRWETGFVTFQWFLSQVSISYFFFILISTLLILLIIIVALKKVISFTQLPLFIFGYLSLFSFYSLVNNVLRQGFSAAFLLLMLVFLEKNKYIRAIFSLIVALSFHMSALIGAILIVLYKIKVPFKVYVYTYIITALTMLFNLNQRIVSLLSFSFTNTIDNYLQQYTSEASLTSYGETNRLDFLLFSLFWFFLALFFYKKFLYSDLFYLLVVKAYAVYGSIFFLFGFISFSDRLAVYSWFLIPLVLFYPLINMQSKYRLIWLILGLAICVLMMYVFNINDYFAYLV
ncbi:hypothetical protein TEH11_0963 [Tetragenococcus halophilus subsp. halophilus]|nr:hypothetical protein TEH11_0963 [Tetragenococcus halophilus subsp. halophilus]